MTIYKSPSPEGIFIYSSCGCGDSCAIRVSSIECYEKPFELALSPEQAIKMGKMLIEVASEYLDGIETGIEYKPEEQL